MIIGKGDKVKYVARIGLGEDEFVHGEGYVTDVGDGVLEVADEVAGVRYSVWDCDAELIIGGRKKEVEHHDKHYKKLGVQPVQIVNDWPLQQQVGAYRMAAIKYLCRLGLKDNELQEAEKAHRFTGWLVQVLKGEKVDPNA